MKIGIDIDEVICYLYPGMINSLNSKFKKNILLEEVYDDHALADIFNVSKEKITEGIHEFTSFENMLSLPLVNDAKDAILKLSNSHEIIFVTSRHPNNISVTKEYLNLPFSNINFNVLFSSGAWKNNNKSKSSHCLEQGITVLIEDNAKYALDCSQKGIKVILFDKPWNKNIEENKNIFRVKNWKEALEKIKEIENVLTKN